MLEDESWVGIACCYRRHAHSKLKSRSSGAETRPRSRAAHSTIHISIDELPHSLLISWDVVNTK